MSDLISEHKRMAMGQSIDVGSEPDMIPRAGADKEAPLSRGYGRGPDCKVSGMPGGEQQRAPFYADAGKGGGGGYDDNDGDEPGKINVRGHKRSMPGMQGSY